MGLHGEGELLYKNASKTIIKNGKSEAHYERCANKENEVQIDTARKRFKISNTCGDLNGSVRGAEMNLGGLANVEGENRMIIVNELEKL